MTKVSKVDVPYLRGRYSQNALRCVRRQDTQRNDIEVIRQILTRSSHSDSFRKMAANRKSLNSSCQFLAFIPHIYRYARRVGRASFIYFE